MDGVRSQVILQQSDPILFSYLALPVEDRS